MMVKSIFIPTIMLIISLYQQNCVERQIKRFLRTLNEIGEASPTAKTIAALKKDLNDEKINLPNYTGLKT